MDGFLGVPACVGIHLTRVLPLLAVAQLTYFHDDVDEKITTLCKEAPELSDW